MGANEKVQAALGSPTVKETVTRLLGNAFYGEVDDLPIIADQIMALVKHPIIKEGERVRFVADRGLGEPVVSPVFTITGVEANGSMLNHVTGEQHANFSVHVHRKFKAEGEKA